MSRIEISNKFTYHNEYFKNSDKKTKLYLPYIDIVVEDFQPKKPVLIDTGASVSILGLEFEDFFRTKTPIDVFPTQYGGTAKVINLKVYEVILTIKGYDFKSRVVFNSAEHNYHVLGHIDFFQKHFDVLLFEMNRNNISENKFKLIRKQ
jgi:hypothetical protein